MGELLRRDLVTHLFTPRSSNEIIITDADEARETAQLEAELREVQKIYFTDNSVSTISAIPLAFAIAALAPLNESKDPISFKSGTQFSRRQFVAATPALLFAAHQAFATNASAQQPVQENLLAKYLKPAEDASKKYARPYFVVGNELAREESAALRIKKGDPFSKYIKGYMMRNSIVPAISEVDASLTREKVHCFVNGEPIIFGVKDDPAIQRQKFKEIIDRTMRLSLTPDPDLARSVALTAEAA